jgi:hypothetical protein
MSKAKLKNNSKADNENNNVGTENNNVGTENNSEADNENNNVGTEICNGSISSPKEVYCSVKYIELENSFKNDNIYHIYYIMFINYNQKKKTNNMCDKTNIDEPNIIIPKTIPVFAPIKKKQSNIRYTLHNCFMVRNIHNKIRQELQNRKNDDYLKQIFDIIINTYEYYGTTKMDISKNNLLYTELYNSFKICASEPINKFKYISIYDKFLNLIIIDIKNIIDVSYLFLSYVDLPIFLPSK